MTPEQQAAVRRIVEEQELAARAVPDHCDCGQPVTAHKYWEDRIYDVNGRNCPNSLTGSEYRYSASITNARRLEARTTVLRTAGDLLAALSAPPAEPLYRKCPDCTGGYVVTEDDEYNCDTCATVGFVPVKAAASPVAPAPRQEGLSPSEKVAALVEGAKRLDAVVRGARQEGE